MSIKKMLGGLGLLLKSKKAKVTQDCCKSNSVKPKEIMI